MSALLGRFQRVPDDEVPIYHLRVAHGRYDCVNAGFEAESWFSHGVYSDEIQEVVAWCKDQFGLNYSISWRSNREHPGSVFQVWFLSLTDATAFRLRWG